MKLIVEPNLGDGDAIYARLVVLLEGGNMEGALARCVRLTLLLANHIGDEQVIHEAMDHAAASLDIDE